MTESTPKIGFVGAGEMASAMIGGLIQSGLDSNQLMVSAPTQTHLSSIKSRFAISTSESNEAVFQWADLVFLATPPSKARQAMVSAQPHQPLVVSLCAGITVAQLSETGCDRVMRAMPNLPSVVGSGATALFAPTQLESADKNTAETVCRRLGLCLWLSEESQMDTVTALSGSGPAYFLYFMQSLIHAGVAAGLPREQARLLVQQTALGAAHLAMESEHTLDDIMDGIVTPGGTTAEALTTFREKKVGEGIQAGFNQAQQRAVSLRSEEE